MSHTDEALQILADLGLPRAQRQERSAYTLLALLDLRPDREWSDATNPLMGITPIMDWAREHYGKEYAPNSRESFRRQTMHQFVQAGIAVYNPDDPTRSVNSPRAVYQIAPQALTLLRAYGSDNWEAGLAAYRKLGRTLVEQYARERALTRVPIRVGDGETLQLSAGEHSELIRVIVEDFGERFAPGGALIYAGDTGANRYFDADRLAALGVAIDRHGKMPDVVIHYTERNWLLVVESVTSHGPVDAKRHEELTRLFETSTAGVVYVTAFPTRSVMARYLAEIAWETEVWVADAPSHLIHFNGVRFLGPYSARG